MVKRICSIILSVLFVATMFVPAYAEEGPAECKHENIKVINIIEATCTESGKIIKQCEKCGDKFEEVTAKLSENGVHEYVTKSVGFDCIESDGYTEEVCKFCGVVKEGSRVEHKRDEDVSKRAHKLVAVSAVAPTCKAPGNTAGTKCSVCGKILDGCKEIAKLSHDDMKNYTKTSTTATCIKAGVATYTCMYCNEQTKIVPEDALGHVKEVRNYVKPTCVSVGNTGNTYCKRCGEDLKLEGDNKEIAIDPNNHAEYHKDIIKEATCQASGLKNVWCTAENGDKKCGYKADNVVIPQHTQKVVEAKAATCEKDGNIEYLLCSCGKKYSNDEWRNTLSDNDVVIPALSHKMVVDKAQSKPVTCLVDGYEVKVCANGCGKTTEKTVIKAEGHKLVQVKAKDPTCKEDGNKWHLKCSKCGVVAVCADNDYNKVKDAIKTSSDFKAAYGWNPNDGALSDKVTITDTNSYDIFEVGQEVSAIDYYRALLYRLPRYAKDSKFWSTTSQAIPKSNHIKDGVSQFEDVDGTAVAPTCVADGKKADQKCKECGDVVSGEVIPATGHKLKTTKEAKAPTCTEAGWTIGTECETCGMIVDVSTAIPALGHDYENAKVLDSAKPNCFTETNGYTVYKCNRCNVTKTVVIPWEHDYKVVSEKAPTCTEKGYKKWACSNPECTKQVTTYIDPLGHKEVVDAAKAATCTDTGLTEGKHCSVCNEVLVKQNVIPVNPANHKIVDIKKDATCTETGLTGGKECELCHSKDVYVAPTVTPALGHDYKEDILKYEVATCTTPGYKVYVCSRCDDENATYKVADVPVQGHIEVVDEAKAATCTETGLTEGKHCSVCNEVLVAQEAVPALGHKVVTKNAKKATYFAAGYTGDKVCSVCGKVITKGKAIAKLVLAKPSIKVTAGSKKLTVKISKKIAGATGYEVSYKVKGGKKAVVKVYSAKSLKKVISKLSKGKTYTVKVRARVKSGSKLAYSSWSSAKTVKVK